MSYLKIKITKFDFLWAVLAPPDPLAVFKGDLLLRAEERKGEKEREGEGKRKVVERGRGKGRRGREAQFPLVFNPTLTTSYRHIT